MMMMVMMMMMMMMIIMMRMIDDDHADFHSKEYLNISVRKKMYLRKVSRQSGSVTKLEKKKKRNKKIISDITKNYLRNEQIILERKENLRKVSRQSGSVTKLEKQNVFKK